MKIKQRILDCFQTSLYFLTLNQATYR